MLAMQNNLQSCGVGIPAGIVGMLPYVATILVLAGLVGRSYAPGGGWGAVLGVRLPFNSTCDRVEKKEVQPYGLHKVPDGAARLPLA